MNILITGKGDWFEKSSHSAQAFYRILPFKELTRTRKDIRVTESASATLPDVMGADIVFLHGPITHIAIEAIASAGAMSKKIWIDLDDMVFDNAIPPANIAWGTYAREQIQRALGIAVSAADVITVSTEFLRQKLIEFYSVNPSKVVTIYNALPDGMWARRAEFRPWIKPDRKNIARIMWRGSVTHEGDLYKFRNAMKPVDNVAYKFYGHLPWLVDPRYDGYLERYEYKEWTKGIIPYFEDLKNEAPHYVVAPLEVCDFNKAKSNIAWLEATYAGAACIGQSDLPEFDRVPTIKFDTPKSLERIFKAIGAGEDLWTEAYMTSRMVVESEYLLSVTNRKREEIIEKLSR